MSSKINLQTCEYACKSSIFQDNQLIFKKYTRKTDRKSKEGYNIISGQSGCGLTANGNRLFCILEEVSLHTPTK